MLAIALDECQEKSYNRVQIEYLLMHCKNSRRIGYKKFTT